MNQILTDALNRWPFLAASWLHRVAVWLLRRVAVAGRRVVGPLSWSARLALLCAVLGGVAGWCGLRGFAAYVSWADVLPPQMAFLEESGLAASAASVGRLLLVSSWLLLLGGLLAFCCRPVAYHILKAVAACSVVVWLVALRFLYQLPSLMFLSEEKILSKELRNYLWVYATWGWLPFFILALLFVFCLCLNDVTVFYGGRPREGLLLGDRLLRNLRSGGEDPQFRVAGSWSSFLHLFVIFLIPVIMRFGCMQKPYGIPKGTGEPVAQMVKVKRIKPKPKEQYVFNPNSAISYYVPDLDDSKIRETVEEETLDTYEASTLTSGIGKGGPGKGGWPFGMENAKVRFIRLRYAGGDWDQQMGKGADYNFLLKFRKLTGFMIAEATEAIQVSDLRRFPKNYAPPFVYLTGSKNISVSARDIKTLRWYLHEEGGMIFADNGGGNFNAAFRSLMQRVLPEGQWIDIANDDIIYRQPYLFPNGAPPLWHHSGRRALGMKHQGRWVVFYHQGDINDAWQTGGSGTSDALQAQAFKMGINVVNYAFNQYMALHWEGP
jgi:hypothetical protein